MQVDRICSSIDSISRHNSTHPFRSSMVGLCFVHRVRYSSARSRTSIQFRFLSPSRCVDVSADGHHRYFLDNQQTVNHQAWIFGLRELNDTEDEQHCFNRSMSVMSLPISDDAFHFTSNYQLRVYTSGCYFIDDNGQWKADGLVVSD